MSDTASAEGSTQLHPMAAPESLPYFIPGADGSDAMMTNVLIALVIIVIVVGTLYLRLHAIPERLAHSRNVAHFELIAVLALVGLFTHNNIFWIAALVLAFIRFPDFSTPLASIAGSLENIAGRGPVQASTSSINAPEKSASDEAGAGSIKSAAVAEDGPKQSVEAPPAAVAHSDANDEEGKN